MQHPNHSDREGEPGTGGEGRERETTEEEGTQTQGTIQSSFGPQFTLSVMDQELSCMLLMSLQVTGSTPQKGGQKRKAADNSGDSQRGRPKKKKT